MEKFTKGVLYIVLVVLVLSGCGTTAPETAALHQVPNNLAPNIAQSYRVVAMETASDGTFIVLAPAQKPTNKDYPKLIYTVVRRELFGWRAFRTGYEYVDNQAVTDNSVIVGRRSYLPASPSSEELRNTGDPFVIGYGADIAPSVTEVEVTFDDGRTLRDSVEHGIYAMVNPTAHTPCRARYFDSNGNLVQEIDWTTNYINKCSLPANPAS